jgi:hypothetical protein
MDSNDNIVETQIKRMYFIYDEIIDHFVADFLSTSIIKL